MKIKKVILFIICIMSLMIISFILSSNKIKFDESKIDKYKVQKMQDKSKEISLEEKNNWNALVKLDKYDEEGKLIKYEVEEEQVPTGYTRYIDGTKITNKINEYKYYIEYYFDGVKNTDLTEIKSAIYNQVISTYTDKISTNSQYKLNKVENLNMKISTDESKNIIKVYYTTKPITVTSVYIDYITGNKIAEDEIIKYENYKDKPYQRQEKDVENYELLSYLTTSNTYIDENYIYENWTYYYKYKSEIVINHIDEITKEILETEIKNGLESEKVITKAKDISSYKVSRKPELEEYTFSKATQIVNYYYVHVSSGVVEKHIDINTDEVLEEKVYNGYEGDLYSTQSKQFENYTLVDEKLPENAKGEMTKDLTEVKYYYIYNTPYTVKHVFGENGGIITSTEIKKENTTYKAEPIENHIGEDGKKYKLDEIHKPDNIEGVIRKKPIEIVFYYIPESLVQVNYIDVKSNEIIEKNIINGWLNEQYETFRKEFENYDLVIEKLPPNATGTMAQDVIEVNYYYIYKSKIMINHVEKNTGRIFSQEIKEGYEGDVIITNESIPEYYKLYKKPEIEKYVLSKNLVTVQYEYTPFEFNIKLEQIIEKLIINNQEKQINNRICKFEIPQNQKQNDIKIYYKIKVSNNSEIDGNTEIYNYIPDGYIAISEDNPEWKINNNIAMISVGNLQVGETREYIIVLTNIDKSKVKNSHNTVLAENSSNLAGFSERTLEDNQDETEVIISIATGVQGNIKKLLIFILGILSILATILIFIYIEKKNK